MMKAKKEKKSKSKNPKKRKKEMFKDCKLCLYSGIIQARTASGDIFAKQLAVREKKKKSQSLYSSTKHTQAGS